jgi:hypothetical protein
LRKTVPDTVFGLGGAGRAVKARAKGQRYTGDSRVTRLRLKNK